MLNLLAAVRDRRRRLRTESLRNEELRRLLRRLERGQHRDVVDCIARVALAICRAGGDHLGDADSIHADFTRIVRLAFDRE